MLHLLLQTFFAFPYGRNHSLSMLIDKDQDPIDKITKLSKKLAITSHLKIFPAKFRVRRFRSISSNRIASLISSVLFEKIFEVNIPTIRLRKLSTFQIQKLIGRDLVWQNIRFILPHQHSGEKHSMERKVVFPKLRFSLLDRPLLSHRNIANRSIKPDVKYFPWIARDWYTPI